jgi:hypothetical protein
MVRAIAVNKWENMDVNRCESVFTYGENSNGNGQALP